MTLTYTHSATPGRAIAPAPRTDTSPPPVQRKHYGGDTRWTAEDAALRPERYMRWLQALPTERWIAIHAAPNRREQDFDQALAVCRAYKAKYAEYTNQGGPIPMRPELQRLQTQMREALKRLNFASPAALWAAYQEHIAARDQHGRNPRHTAHIASVDHYQWLRHISRVPQMDWYAGGTEGIYNNIDAALESTRQRRVTYAPADDIESPAARLVQLETRIANLKAQRKSLPASIREADPQPARQLKRLYNQIAADLEIAQAEYAELDQILHPQKYGIERDPADQRELIALAAPDYGLTRTAPIPDDGRWQIIDLDDRLAATLDAIRSLLSLHAKNQDVIFEMETYPQKKRTIAHNASLTARYELQDAITRSLGQHYSRQLARHAPPAPSIAETAVEQQPACPDPTGAGGPLNTGTPAQAETPALQAPVAVHCREYDTDAPDYVFVGRPSKWGNPYRIGPDGDRAAVIAKYRRYLAQQPDLIAALPELTGKKLGCFCKPAACHADVLIVAWRYYVGLRPQG